MYRRRRTTRYKNIINFFKRRLHYKTKMNQIICVLIILILLLMLKRINNSLSSDIIRIIDNSIKYEFNIMEDGKKILGYGKELFTLSGKALSAISLKDSPRYIPPIKGSIYNPFGETRYLDGSTFFNEGVDIIPDGDNEPVFIEDGVIKKIEDRNTKGFFVEVEHENMVTVYGYLVNTYVNQGEKVVQGTRIGSLGTNKDGNKYLHFEIWVDGKPINPSEYVSFNRKF